MKIAGIILLVIGVLLLTLELTELLTSAYYVGEIAAPMGALIISIAEAREFNLRRHYEE